jgi:hypothetical protein
VAIFHLGILLSMNLVFLNVPQLLVFANWDVLTAWFNSLVRHQPSREQENALREASFPS